MKNKLDQIREEMKNAEGLALKILASKYLAYHYSKKLDNALEKEDSVAANRICDSMNKFQLNYQLS